MYAHTNGIRTYYEVHGREGAPWLVLAHSLACSCRMWDPQIEAFRQRYRVLAYDARGHGASEAPPGPYTLELLADDLKALLDALGVERPHYCGLSMGGMIGQTFALRFPGRLRTLTLADTTSRFPPEVRPVWAERIRTAETQGMEALAPPTLERWFTAAFRAENPALVDSIRRLIVATPVAGYVGCAHAIVAIDLTARLGAIACPALVIVGEDDPGTPVAMARAIHAQLPDARLVVIPRAAHLTNLEAPVAFNGALEEFLAVH